MRYYVRQLGQALQSGDLAGAQAAYTSLSQLPQFQNAGGQQSFATAGLNPDHVTAMVVNVPAGFDVNGEKAGRRTGYPGWPGDNAAIMQAAER